MWKKERKKEKNSGGGGGQRRRCGLGSLSPSLSHAARSLLRGAVRELGPQERAALAVD